MVSSVVPRYLWVQYKVGNQVKVPTAGCEDVADLIEAVKKKFAMTFAYVDPCYIYLKPIGAELPWNPQTKLREIFKDDEVPRDYWGEQWNWVTVDVMEHELPHAPVAKRKVSVMEDCE